MLKKLVDNFKKKSLKERFLLVIGIVLFLGYFILGLIFILWKDLPITMEYNYRITFGIVIIVYSFIRFIRIINSNTEEE
ncbi:MAG TPA: hypothetical protein VN192_06625 [Flavobacterium sp.]|nr:hypothetical protein [Flavobacterium sp.]